MRILIKHRLVIIALFAIFAAYFATRLYDIMNLPLFTDEAIYVRWSQIAKQDANWRFISLTDGKQPSFVWLAMTVMRFVEDPLLAGRLVSVFAGFATTIGMFFLGKELFKNTLIGVFSSLLYLVFPMALVYDRMALYDSLVGMFITWSLYLSLLLARHVRLDIALIQGIVIGGGALTKSNAFFAVPIMGLALLLFDWSRKEKIKRLVMWIALVGLATVIGIVCYSILRLSPFFHIIEQKTAIFAYPFGEWIEHPTRFFVGNLRGIFDWFITYLTIPLFIVLILSLLPPKKSLRAFLFTSTVFLIPFAILIGVLHSWGVILQQSDILPEGLPFAAMIFAIIALLYSLKTDQTNLLEKVFLLLCFITPVLYLAFFGKLLYPRFILFMILPLLPLIAYGLYVIISHIKSTLVKVGVILLILFVPLLVDFYILTDFARSPIPYSDLEQYSNSWPAGGGTKEVIAFLSEQAIEQKIYVASEGTFGSLPTYAVEIYLDRNKNIEKRGIWPLPQDIPQDLVEKAKTMPVYFLFNQSQVIPQNWPIQFIAKYRKGVGEIYMNLYQVVP